MSKRLRSTRRKYYILFVRIFDECFSCPSRSWRKAYSIGECFLTLARYLLLNKLAFYLKTLVNLSRK
jgi:hypothetical protein